MVGWYVNAGRNGPHHRIAKMPNASHGMKSKSGVIYRLDHRAETASDRGVLTQKKVVACPPGTAVLEFGATVQRRRCVAVWVGLRKSSSSSMGPSGCGP